MKNVYSIQIEYSPIYECLISFYAYVNQKESKHFWLGSAWREQTRQQLPASFAAELEDERWEVLHRIVLLAAQSPQKESVEAFLAWLEGLPAGEMYERLAPWVDAIPLNLGEIRDKSLSLLTRWNETYFSRLQTFSSEQVRESARHFQQLAATLDGPALIDAATNGIWIEPTESLQRVVLVPQVHCAPATILDFHGSMATVLYPVIDGELIREEPIAKLLGITQCLADEKRLLILRALAEKSHTLGELQQAVSLAKSTVHHHVTALRRAGLIRAHYLDHTAPHAYSLRESALEELPGLLSRFLRNGDRRR
ncbi:winged helix-turn-helix transcriptional regulator [Brevibacillus composti]|uniref:Winged helix-turn-helix transcriptional regulator n=1 Tax=Brevibacillus composti TaxID=2796470 RepID=A0A7T5EJC2_9BACL|nr:ArsR family transcriptional regulator [Brevibacillus composti]QQE73674.1 winged helix-turn-helix transcriptional regulator [Brevibacillus composti]QUO40757.1 winged helix-turn-helix transcriptional regulator [Brevibacillus composti]